MPPGQNGELPEFPVNGPFDGIQSEQPTEQLGTGFTDALNVMFRLGKLRARPAFTSGVIPNSPLIVRIMDLGGTIADQGWTADGRPYLQPTTLPVVRIMDLVGTIADQNWAPGTSGVIGSDFFVTNGSIGYFDASGNFISIPGVQEKWTGTFDFFTVRGERIQVATTPSQIYYNSPSGWQRLLTPISDGVPSFTEIGQRLAFTQGVDPIRLWDGLRDSLITVPGAPAARYIFEYGNHLLALNTLESGGRSYQRVRWSGAGDPTDWSSFNSGQVDLYNDLGPINGGVKLMSYAYIFQQMGIVQMQLTGNGLMPFYFDPKSARSKGLVIPRSLAVNGENTCFYVGQDNVYMFDGTASNPVGDMPMQGRARAGALTHIFGDLMLAGRDNVFGFVSMSINGNPYNAYWLVIPNVAIWVLNIKDMTWTRWTVTGTPSCIGNYLTQTQVRIMDLIGDIAHQQWTPATLLNENPFPSVMLGMADGTAKLFDFSGWSEEGFLLRTGEMDYGDQRHESATKKVRLIYKDNGECIINIVFENEDGAQSVNAPGSETSGLTLKGTGRGRARKIVFPVNLPGQLITMEINGEAGIPFELSSYAPIYSPSGEIRNAL